MTQFGFDIGASDREIMSAAQGRQAQLIKPSGSLGLLESTAVQLAGWQRTPEPQARPAAAILFAADHPVSAHGVSAYPPAVTRAMVRSFASGGAAASVLARSLGIPLHVVDVGVDVTFEPNEPALESGCVRDPVALEQSGDIRTEDAMSQASYERTLAAGAAAVERLGPGLKVLILGEMGIGNTTVASAVAAALCGGDAAGYVGAGTGVYGSALEHKRKVVAECIARLGGERDVHEILRRVGGRDVVALVGAMAAALEQRAAVLVDGFIVSVAALALVRLVPSAVDGMIFAHRSAEHAHGSILEALAARPLLSLGMRLGEASGALLAHPVLELACKLHNDMATFESARVPDREA